MHFSYGQKQDYDGFIATLGKLTNEQAYTRLIEHQKQNPHFPNTYIQLGHISEKIASEIDPFKDQYNKHLYLDNAILFYDLLPYYFKDNDIRKTKHLYANIPLEANGFTVTNDGIIAYVKSRVEYCKKQKETITTLYKAIGKSKDHYNNCVRIFNSINNSFDNYNEMLLKTDDLFLGQLSELEKEFNSTIKAFGEYKDLLKQFPIPGYNQAYTLSTIKTFRLEGITNSDFLKNSFNLWDYGEWVLQFRKVYESDIMALRKEIEKIQKLFDDNLTLISKLNYADTDVSLKSYDEFFLFRMGRFDSNSLLRELFSYNDKRQNYLYLAKNGLNNPSDSSSSLMNRKLRYYYKLALDRNSTLKELATFNSAITPEKVSRFNGFFSKHYNGLEGLKMYQDKQIKLLESTFSTSLVNLSSYLENEIAGKNREKFAKTLDGKIVVPLFQNKITDITSTQIFVTEEVQYSNDKPQYVSGYVKKKDIITPFVAKIKSDTIVQWVKELDTDSKAPKDLLKSAKKVFAYQRGVACIVSYDLNADNQFLIASEKRFVNTLVHLNDSGKVISSKLLNSMSFPIYLQYDEIGQQSNVVFANRDNNDSGVFNNFSICQVDTSGIKWETTLNLKGNFIDLIKTESKYIAYMNFQQYDINGEYKVTGNSGSNWAFLMANINSEGIVSKIQPVISEESSYLTRVFSLSSNEINLLGYKGTPTSTTRKLNYYVFTTNGELIFSNTGL
jgi:hypothetical protein